MGLGEHYHETRLELVVLAVLAVGPWGMVLGGDDWPAFPVEWKSSPAVDWPADVSFLLQAPAGREGFVRVEGGHLVRADGRRLRLWGINATGKAALPATDAAPAVADGLARRGINCVRFHFLDRPAPAGLIAAGDDTRSLDPRQMERLDCFVAELKRRGVYRLEPERRPLRTSPATACASARPWAWARTPRTSIPACWSSSGSTPGSCSRM